MRTATSFHLSLSLLLLLVAKTFAEDENTDFLMNVFSDLGPVLALFGEQFARQFLSETFTWYDHLIFACIPLGIMTAIAGAIRVEGRGVLKAFIGRARENKAAAEIEYMSSTSAEVGELFNGKGIVRTMGQSKIAQFIIFPQLFNSHKKEFRETHGIHTLKSATEEGVLRKDDYRDELDMRYLKWFNFGSTSRQDEPEDGASKNSVPPKYWESLKYPNLQLNIAAKRITATQRSVELHLAAIAAIVLQASLLALAAVIAYQVRDFDRQPWGLPCYIGGSVLLFIGMLACSVAIERSTKEYKWFPNDLATTTSTARTIRKPEQPMSLFWVQGKQRVSDQEFGSYIIYAQNKDYVSTSSRKDDVRPKRNDKLDQNESSHARENLEISDQNPSQYRDIRALTALFAGGAGFTIQFIGLRGLPWPVAVAHLGAIIVMAIIRAWIRRRLGEDTQYYEVPSEYELDFLAVQLVETKCRGFQSLEENPRPLQEVLSWRVDTAKHGNKTIYSFDFLGTNESDATDIDSHNQYMRRLKKDALNEEAQKVMSVRKRLGDLCEWETRAFKSALALVRSIERFLDEFIPGGTNTRLVSWKLPFKNFKHKIGSIELKITKEKEVWKINAGEVEAVLSLWMANLEANKMARANIDKQTEWQRTKAGVAWGVDYCRILGRKYDNGVLQRDLNWWVGNPATSEIKTERNQEVTGPQSDPGNAKIVIGYTGTANDLESPTLLVQHSTAGLTTIAAQHLFTHFIWTVVDRYLPKDFLDQNSISITDSVSIQPAKQLDLPSSKPTTGRRMSHNKLTQLALHGEKDGLGLLNDILLCLIPVFSMKDCLPNDATLLLDLPKLSDQKSWSKAIPRYSGLLDFTEKSIGCDFEDYLALAVVVHALDFAYLIILDGENMGYGKGSQHKSTTGTKTNPERLQELNKSVNSDQSQDPEGSNEPEPAICSETKHPEMKSIAPNMKSKIYAPQQSDDSRKFLTYLSKSFSKVIKKLSIFYVLQGKEDFLSKLGCLYNMVPENTWSGPQGIPGFMEQIRFTKAHREFYETHRIDLKNLQGKDLEKRDIFGWTVLHYAAASRECETVGGIQNNSTPGNHKPRPIDALKETVPGRWWLDNFGRSPIHVASLTGSVQFLEILLASLSDGDVRSALQSKGQDGMTPVHLAIAGGHEKCIEVFMKLPCFFQVEIKEDAWQRSPVHLAIARGQYKCCTALIDNEKFQFNPNTLDVVGKSLFYYLDENNKEQKKVGTILLKKHSTKFNERDNEGQSVWHHAIRFLSPDSIGILQEKHKPTIDSRNRAKETPLYLAVKLNNDKMVDSLLSRGANPSISPEEDRSPLMLACKQGRTNMVCSMLDKDKQAARDQDRTGKTALHYAVESKDFEDNDHEIIVEQLVKAMKIIDVEDRQSCTPLHIACRNSIVSAVSILLKSGANPDIKDKSGYNALYHTMLSWPTNDKKLTGRMQNITKILLEKAPTCMGTPDNGGHTPLTKACVQGRPLDFISLVVELSNQKDSKLELNQGDSYLGEPPLAWACEMGHTEVVKTLLLAKGLDVNKRLERYRGLAPLHFALISQKPDVVRLLICDSRFNHDFSTENIYGLNLAQYALENADKECLKVMLLHKTTRSAIFSAAGWEGIFQKHPSLADEERVQDAFESAICENGNAVKFPVHRLASLGPSYKIKSLLASGKNVCELDEDGWTPADVARRYSHKELEELLRPHEPIRDLDISPYLEPSTFISLFKGPESEPSDLSSHDGCSSRTLAIKFSEDGWFHPSFCYLRTREAIPPNAKHFYFEVEILRPLQHGRCAVGFCQSYVPKNQLPGCHESSFAYHGSDGMFYVSQKFGTPQENAEPFEKGDIVGCGLNLETGQGYRTKNGVLLGSSREFQDRRFSTGKFYPCIGATANGQRDEFQVRVTLRSSPECPFHYSGPYNGLLLINEWPKVDRVVDEDAESVFVR